MPTARPLVQPAAGAWLWAPLWANRGLFGQVALAAVLINIFAMATALFSMAVYNKILPNNATQSMLALVIGVGIVIVLGIVATTAEVTTSCVFRLRSRRRFYAQPQSWFDARVGLN